MSFISPEKIIQNKDVFLFQEFTKQYHFNKTVELLTKYSNFLSFKYGLNIDELTNELKEFAESEKEELRHSIKDDYANFLNKTDFKLQ